MYAVIQDLKQLLNLFEISEIIKHYSSFMYKILNKSVGCIVYIIIYD